jgi:hypothetical protein
MTLQALQEELRLADPDIARDALRFWQSKGVLAAVPTSKPDAAVDYPTYTPVYESEDVQWVIVESGHDSPGSGKTGKSFAHHSRRSASKFTRLSSRRASRKDTAIAVFVTPICYYSHHPDAGSLAIHTQCAFKSTCTTDCKAAEHA